MSIFGYVKCSRVVWFSRIRHCILSGGIGDARDLSIAGASRHCDLVFSADTLNSFGRRNLERNEQADGQARCQSW